MDFLANLLISLGIWIGATAVETAVKSKEPEHIERAPERPNGSTVTEVPPSILPDREGRDDR
jgi:hypothetical protein